MRLRRLYSTVRFWDRAAMLKDQPVFALHEEPEPLQRENPFAEPTDLRRELAKLGKTQLRAQTVIESALEGIRKMVEGLKAAFDRMGRRRTTVS